MKMKYVFGPVPSRRLGQSLGIDPIPLKTCIWNCVYCQLGRSKPLVHERRVYFPRQEIIAEIEPTLASHKPGEIDWITFVGSGETTLHADLGWLIRQVKSLTQLPVAVITNGSLLYLPEVRQELAAADAVLPSLDAGNARLYRKINRPHPQASFERLVAGMESFRHEYSGQLWVEVMLVQGLNDDEASLREIGLILKRIRPDQVHILEPTRPPAETWVQPPDQEGLLRARAILGDTARTLLGESESLVEAIVGIVTRHPMREDELTETLTRFSPEEVSAALAELERSGRVQIVARYGVRFWTASPAYFP
jgi:wyosine [tRNA(Phe)-imidazoG37] synthetase (radical SAM superfamily)